MNYNSNALVSTGVAYCVEIDYLQPNDPKCLNGMLEPAPVDKRRRIVQAPITRIILAAENQACEPEV